MSYQTRQRLNYLFLGSDAGIQRATTINTLIAIAKLNGVNPDAYPRHVLARIADQSDKQLDTLLP